MSLLVLMYHRSCAGRHGNSAEMLEAHFSHIARTYRNVLPGDALEPGALNVCLSFDDGYFDFYGTVFPLLKIFNLRALLAIPPIVLQDSSALPPNDRLRVQSEEAFSNPDFGGFCTWPELKEMAASGHVSVAAHGFSHTPLDGPNGNLFEEMDTPKAMLKGGLDRPIESFVFPFGRYSERSLHYAQRKYRYVFRIGGALNHSWEKKLLYRVDADAMNSPTALFSTSRLALYHARYFWNRLRGR
jgi:peptidoglycan/xylan/chitin deacetylase (PgdA/CDA1 family)